MTLICFTEYVLPHGTRQPRYFDVSAEAATKAKTIIDSGLSFECEKLTTGDWSFTIVDRKEECDVAILLNSGKESLEATVERLIRIYNPQFSEARDD